MSSSVATPPFRWCTCRWLVAASRWAWCWGCILRSMWPPLSSFACFRGELIGVVAFNSRCFWSSLRCILAYCRWARSSLW
uniref:Putative secreted protein n=1 Tax=Anopheles darlingi TaxID=43151 RepID=A0A2M4D735_ANODA